jgi:hypothetical protein
LCIVESTFRVEEKTADESKSPTKDIKMATLIIPRFFRGNLWPVDEEEEIELTTNARKMSA